MEKEARHHIFTSAHLGCLTPFCATVSINSSQNSENYLITKYDSVEVPVVHIQIFTHCHHPKWEWPGRGNITLSAGANMQLVFLLYHAFKKQFTLKILLTSFILYFLNTMRDSLQITYHHRYHQLEILCKASTSQLDSDRDVILALSWSAVWMTIYYLVHPCGVP